MFQAFKDGTLGTGVNLVMRSGNSYFGSLTTFKIVRDLNDLRTPLPKINEYISQFPRQFYCYSLQILLGSPGSQRAIY